MHNTEECMLVVASTAHNSLRALLTVLKRFRRLSWLKYTKPNYSEQWASACNIVALIDDFIVKLKF